MRASQVEFQLQESRTGPGPRGPGRLMDFKGKEIEQDVGCNAMSVWQTYNAATDRIPELSPPVLNIGCMLEDTWVSSNINVKFAQNHFLTKIP